MKRLTLMVLLGASLAGCAGDPVKLQQNHTYVLEWFCLPLTLFLQ